MSLSGDDLLDGLDDLPSMMTQLASPGRSGGSNKFSTSCNSAKASEARASRFQELGPNQSIHMSVTLNANEDHPKPSNQLASQARKVLNHLNTLQTSSKTGPIRSTEENAKLAEQKLRSLKENGVDLNKFYYQYDTLRTGSISYKDFSDTLLAVSSGIGREDAMLLAASLDKKKTGHIEYKNILSTLNKLQKECQQDHSLTHSLMTNKKQGSSSSHQQQQQRQQQEEEILQAALLQQQEQEKKQKAMIHHIPSSSSSSSSSYLEMYKQRINTAIKDPKAIVDVQLLSPNVHDAIPQQIPSPNKPTTTTTTASGSTAEEPMVFYSGRRYFYNPEKTVSQASMKDNPAVKAINARLKDRSIPFHVDPTVDEVKEQHRREREREQLKYLVYGGKRSSSAPPRSHQSGTTLMKYVEQSIQEINEATGSNAKTSSSMNNKKSPHKEHFSHSLKAALLEEASSQQQKQGDASTDSTPSSLSLKAKEEQILDKLEQANKRQLLAKQSQSKVLENRVVRQLAGKMNNLRHILRLQDRSKSGIVNLPEFRQAMIKCGVNISPQETQQLFEGLADYKTNGGVMDPGYSLGGKALNIENFVNRLQNRTTSSAFAHVVEDVKTHCGQKVSDLTRINEETRVIKKVLLAMSKVSEPKTLIDSVSSNGTTSSTASSTIAGIASGGGKGSKGVINVHAINNVTNGMLTKEQFRQTLKLSGANLQDHEFDVLLRTLKLDNTNSSTSNTSSNNSASSSYSQAYTNRFNNNTNSGTGGGGGDAVRIDMNHIDQVLFQELVKLTKEQEKQKESTIKQNPRYGQTFASQITLGNENGYEFDSIIDSKKLRQDSLQWYKLMEHLQKNYDKVLDAFKTSTDGSSTTISTAADAPAAANSASSSKATTTGKDSTTSSNSTSMRDSLDHNLRNNKYKVHNPHLPRDQSMLHHRQTDVKNVKSSISFDELKSGLKANGVVLSDSDFVRLQHHIQSTKGSNNNNNNGDSSRLSLEDFCSVVGIPVRYHDNHTSKVETVELVDSHLNKVRDVGVFATSEKSIAATSKYGTSMYLETDDSVHRALFSHRKKKFQSLSEYTKDPSKFWDLVNSVEDPLLFPYPQPSCRDPVPSHKARGILTKDALRGVVSLADHINQTTGMNKKTGINATAIDGARGGVPAQKPRLTVQELTSRNAAAMSGSYDYTSGGFSSSDDGRLSTSTREEYANNNTNRPRIIGGKGKRASSAPPRTSSAAMSDDGSVGSFVIRGAHHTSTSSNNGSINGDDAHAMMTLNNIQKWTSAGGGGAGGGGAGHVLSDFFTNEVLNNNNNKAKAIRGGGGRTRSNSGNGGTGVGGGNSEGIAGGGSVIDTPYATDLNNSSTVAVMDSLTPMSFTSASTQNGTFSNPGTPRSRGMRTFNSNNNGLTGSAAAPFATSDN